MKITKQTKIYCQNYCQNTDIGDIISASMSRFRSVEVIRKEFNKDEQDGTYRRRSKGKPDLRKDAEAAVAATFGAIEVRLQTETKYSLSDSEPSA